MKYLTHYLLIILFIAFIALMPIMGVMTPDEEVSLRENRRLNTFPSFSMTSIEDITLKLDAYFDDHFAFRDKFIDLKEKISDRISGHKRNRFRAVVGQSDWAFYEGCVEHYQGRFSEEKIDAFLKDLEHFSNQITVPVLVAVVPNKAYVYDEYLPDYVQGSTQRKQTIEKISDINNIHVLDLLPSLKQESITKQTYMNYDTHWNGWGAYIAYKEIMNFINKNITISILAREDIASIEINDRFEGGIAAMLGKAGEIYDTNSHVVFSNQSAQEYQKETSVHEGVETLHYKNHKGLGRAIILHDSFVEAHLGDYFSETFYETSLYRTFDFVHLVEQIKKENPDFVLIEIVERHIYSD